SSKGPASAHQVVTRPPPSVAGVQNRNRQIVSTRAGIERAIELGAPSILKTRTYLAIRGDSVFEQAERWLHNFDATKARRLGLQNRLVVPSSYTRKYLLYHP